MITKTILPVLETQEWKDKYNKKVELYNDLVEELEAKGIDAMKLVEVARAIEEVERLYMGCIEVNSRLYKLKDLIV
jgi:hypothetical protein